MRLTECTWKEVNELDREKTVIVIPTGAVEQHGPHLPLGTDTYLATAAAEEIAAQCPDITLVTPCLWQGCSLHHMPFSGTISNSFNGYHESLRQIVLSLAEHHFLKFLTINGHGGNCDSNNIVFRDLRSSHKQLQLAAANYFDFIDQTIIETVMQGPIKGIKHACEAEVSLMMHKHLSLVRKENIRDDGLAALPPIPGLISNFDEVTEEGSLGFATFAKAETGASLWNSVITNGAQVVKQFSEGYSYLGYEE